jgi:tRNA A37 threonylcarbamoyladenosine synthetase subunit TsaC/SUA5/YrdC
VDLTGATPRILRPGPVGVARIAEVLGVDPESLTAQA